MATKKRSDESNVGRQHAHTLNFFTRDGHVRPLIDIEREVVSLSLVKNHGNVTKAAAELGIGRTTLYRYTKKQIVGPGAPKPPRPTRRARTG